MREAISNTAELGAVLGGARVVDEHVRQNMRAILDEVRSGRFAKALRREAADGYPKLDSARAQARSHVMEQVFSELKKLDES
jgi:ketol-acid reductoisomerase